MKSFKIWLEEHDADVQARRQNYFDQVMRTLQATEDDLSKPLTDLQVVKTSSPVNGEAQPPQKGAGAISKLQNLLGGLVQRMSNDQSDVETSVRAKRAMEMLNKRGTDGMVQPVLYLQDFLRELFGNDFHTKYIDREMSKDDTPVPPPMGPKPQQLPQQSPQMPQPNPGMPQLPPGGLQFA